MYLRAIQIVTAIAGIITTLNQRDSGPALKDVLLNKEVEDLPILVFSIAGKTRTGKSFLLNSIIQYLEAGGKQGWWKNPIHNAFDWKGGIESITKGLWILPKIYKLTNVEGKQVGVLLMDNQGLFDGEQSDGESIVLSGISTSLSYVQMFNVKEKITSDDLLNIYLYLVDGMDKAELKSTNTRFMFIVRDFMGREDFGSGLASGKKYINEEKQRGTQEHKDKWQMLLNTFNEIECLLLPHPGIKITTKNFKDSGTLAELDTEFISELDSFFRTTFAPNTLIPKADTPTGKNIYDILNKVNGRKANDIQSFFHMVTEERNEYKLEKLVAEFEARMKLLENDLHSAHGVLMQLQQRGANSFIGKSANDYLTRLTEGLQEILNNQVRQLIVTKYTGGLGIAVESNHKAQWPSTLKSLGDLVYGPNKRKIIAGIVEKLASNYYDRLSSELYKNFKQQCTTHDCSVNPRSFEECLDFVSAGGSPNVLEELWERIKRDLNQQARNHEQHIQTLKEQISRREKDKHPLLEILEFVVDVPYFAIIQNIMSSSPLLSSVFLGDSQKGHNTQEGKPLLEAGR